CLSIRRDSLLFGRSVWDGIALTALLAEQGLLAADRSPIRPQWSPERPAAPRPPHFSAKAKNVVVIFCSGALSHLDVWDYKPELVKRNGQALPNSKDLVTFQGANGALTQPLWEFKARGQSGKMISDMLPHLAELAAKMQLSAAEVTNLNRESAKTLEFYGATDSNQLKARFAKNCILARRLIEKGVRFVQLFNGAYAMGEGVGNWDGHKSLKAQYD